MNKKLYLRLLLLPFFIFIVSFSQAQTITASEVSGSNAACFNPDLVSNCYPGNFFCDNIYKYNKIFLFFLENKY